MFLSFFNANRKSCLCSNVRIIVGLFEPQVMRFICGFFPLRNFPIRTPSLKKSTQVSLMMIIWRTLRKNANHSKGRVLFELRFFCKNTGGASITFPVDYMFFDVSFSFCLSLRHHKTEGPVLKQQRNNFKEWRSRK